MISIERIYLDIMRIIFNYGMLRSIDLINIKHHVYIYQIN